MDLGTDTDHRTHGGVLGPGQDAFRRSDLIREFHQLHGFKIGYKPAGGIASAKQALQYLVLMKEELGDDWLQPALFRFGASSLLTDVERQLEHFVTGQYSANHRHAMV